MTTDGYRWALEFQLPDGTAADPYDPADMAQALREVADQVEIHDLPPTGYLWDRSGRLIASARLHDGGDLAE